MKNKVIENRGSALVLIIIVTAVITTLGLTCLSISMGQFRIRKSNSEHKRALYKSEGGLDYAYEEIYDLICSAVEDSISKSDEYLLAEPGDIYGASDVFKNNFKQVVDCRIVHEVENCFNAQISVLNGSRLMFVNDELIARVSSKYISESGIIKITSADIIVYVPDYLDIISNTADISDLLHITNFDM
ncbi:MULTISPECIES: hypothetical protein [unclassified Sedimentibacter]|uniref:hypothetical protein n=1 Tax=unclassified Sedimentibacter TaxID=2649220 RepID=UPI0027E1EBCF|nr:hypothetical protein [Sedimentibacter sp. MB35-C1]WMJ76663.1 hypothetical protein RBQ61_13875 [Sedimentibacter sp. MB35-C1]